ncbi:phosphoribosylanthranilate isomerase [Methanocaldococcus fervens]|uniref:N-(5'-phosphoribosyl)anthranilate isomerase n=1 Tax=Methanocaldococcus fervens (strain DSM 4213 / JCM 15782 / AG86) TaxID=573064 RepID=C7P8X2_METFA|nr:phosphoribosylanthranilate isomerase [Methanocaldococcus fervens]ACV25004.1 Phosphoribosylanthranilate isomerase [Methanocaldococcus fervens AG86]
MVKVKICGITNKEDMLYISKKVHAVGVIIDVPVKTPRKISLDKALELKKYVAPFTSLVSVLMPNSIDEVLEVYNALKPNAIQLHGFESLDFVKELRNLKNNGNLNADIIKVIHIPKDEEIDFKTLLNTAKDYEKYVDAILVDTKIEKIKLEGKTHHWEVSKKLRELLEKPLILAGGLNKDNVLEAVNTVKPYAIDVSSSLEDYGGKKNLKKVDEFLEIIKKI